VDSGELLLKILSKAEWILANLLSKAGWILANVSPSRVDSRKPFIESRVDSRKCLSKAEWILANLLSKAEWILANDLPSRVDSRKSCTKPSGFWRNLLQNRVDFRQTFISQTDSLQIFLLSKVRMSPMFFRMLVIIPIKIMDGISFVCWSLSQ